MTLLIDTHVLVWALLSPEKIPPRFRAQIEDPASRVLFSSVSVWELAIKLRLGKLQLDVELEDLVEAAELTGFEELSLTGQHALKVRNLPFHHRDPFDRALIAQASHEPARLLTADTTFAKYSDLVEIIA